ncbi:sulfur carrier protein ThiS [Paraglaciecola aquimarina]|uniref:Sulfur carrier protein ThiS n=1 Tax=Paraglaciecola aquimarina TaxID=1235557 RepID=A0ABU3SSG4_9ALTE|nr:sulfur carrier protein ThiS [Paraglaciecola aquimarina]MDU0352930.1 sulfur carrier protein ThiS [Paraglaciecola aquimarina]
MLMLDIYINQQKLAVKNGSNLQHAVEQYLSEYESIELANVALVVNQNIIPRSYWQSRLCRNQERFEIFSAVAGG